MANTPRYTSWKINPPPRKRPCSPETRMEQALRFKAMYSRLGFTVADVACFLQVTPRTVHAWISGRVRIPFAAYKLLRVQLHYELPGDAWSGWCLSAGRLYTPEGHELRPQDFTWWGLLARKAAMFSSLYERLAATVPDRRQAQRGVLAPSLLLPCRPSCSKVVWRRKNGACERALEVPPMVITGTTSRSSTS